MRFRKAIAIIGLGYVGLPLALLADKKGYKVIGIDINFEKVELIKKRISSFIDENISVELQNSSLEATTDFSKVKDVDIVVICVPTPVYHNHKPNLKSVESASRGIAPYLRKGQLIILESTVSPGISEEIVLPILEELSGFRGGEDFYLAHCPERINPGDKKWNVENIPRVVGSLEEKGLKKALNFYRSILISDVKPMNSLKEAEAVKIVENSFRDINIAFVNELAMSFSKLGIDVVNVIEGAATKPFAFMPHYPGCGIGGHCIPVDPYYLISYAKKNGFHHDLLSLARRINNGMPKFAVDKVVEGLNEKKVAVKGTEVAVLGLAYKANVGDCRESPSFDIIRHLNDLGAIVSTYDPYVLDKSTCKTIEEATKGAKAVVIATAHNDFKKLEPDYLLKNGVKVVVDGRNCLPKEKFINLKKLTYIGIGR